MRWILVVILLFTGCSKQPKSVSGCVVEGVKAPEWVCGVKDGRYIMAKGFSKQTHSDFFLQKEIALALARDSLAYKIAQKVKNALLKMSDKRDDIDFISKEIAIEALKYSTQLESWRAPDKRVYILVGVLREDVRRAVRDSYLKYKNIYKKIFPHNTEERLREIINTF